jgi:UDPglucose--hexose-1-phosphate uridylyltransferase
MNLHKPHRRLNPLTGEWVLVSPQRTTRPWRGEVTPRPRASWPLPAHDPSCHLCPGNVRASGERNPEYEETFVFNNDFPALVPDTMVVAERGPGWKIAHAEQGLCRVICYSPRHDLTLADLSSAAVHRVVETWVQQMDQLLTLPWIGYVQIFENRGEMMGCSNPHPHGQLWATRETPVEVAKEERGQARYLEEHGRCLLCEVLEDEVVACERVICANPGWVALVPFWAVWPYETLVLPRRHVADLTGLSDADQRALVDLLQTILSTYDRLFDVTMPLSFGWHQSPRRGASPKGWHLHAHFYPPLLRSAEIKKHMVGYEMLGGPQRDITPEHAAQLLRYAVPRSEGELAVCPGGH